VFQEVTMALTAEEARGTILAQHDTIRMLLRAAGTVADLAAGGSRRVADLLPHYLDSVRAALDQHLLYEDRTLLPILEADPPLGPERARRLRTEHRQQRAELAALGREREQIADHPATVAQRLRALVDTFLADMDEEERLVLTRNVLRDDAVIADQECG
jgi:iron-sulfur cluster repair protein YtfE (RIC family)